MSLCVGVRLILALSTKIKYYQIDQYKDVCVSSDIILYFGLPEMLYVDITTENNIKEGTKHIVDERVFSSTFSIAADFDCRKTKR